MKNPSHPGELLYWGVLEPPPKSSRGVIRTRYGALFAVVPRGLAAWLRPAQLLTFPWNRKPLFAGLVRGADIQRFSVMTDTVSKEQ
jgi:hypothetical protein